MVDAHSDVRRARRNRKPGTASAPTVDRADEGLYWGVG